MTEGFSSEPTLDTGTGSGAEFDLLRPAPHWQHRVNDLLVRRAWVRVSNPANGSSWEGRLVAWHADPGVVIDPPGQPRICLPAAFSIDEVEPPPCHLYPCSRRNGSGSEPATDPDEAAGLVLVGRDDVWKAAGALMACGSGGPSPFADLADRLADAAGSAPSGHPTSPESDGGHAAHIPGTPEAQEAAEGDVALCGCRPGYMCESCVPRSPR
jgi:hypothetical protein